MAEETEEEFKTRMAAISSGYKKDRSERKIQLAAEGKALAKVGSHKMTMTRDDDPHYGGSRISRYSGYGIAAMASEMMRMAVKEHLRSRYESYDEVDNELLCRLSDWLHHIEPTWPKEKYLRRALSYGLGRDGRDHVNMVDDDYLPYFYTMDSPSKIDDRPQPYITVSTRDTQASMDNLDRKYRGFKRWLQELMQHYRQGRHPEDIRRELEILVMDRYGAT